MIKAVTKGHATSLHLGCWRRLLWLHRNLERLGENFWTHRREEKVNAAIRGQIADFQNDSRKTACSAHYGLRCH